MHWQEDILDHPDAPLVSFTLVDISRIEQRHLAIVEFFLFYLPGTPVLKYGQEVGRDPENQVIPGMYISKCSHTLRHFLAYFIFGVENFNDSTF